MLRSFGVLALLLVCVGSYSGLEPRPILGKQPAFTATPITLDPGDPARRKVGALTLIAGWRLTSRDPAFGSFSAMAVTGDRFTLVSDAGGLVRFRFRDGRVSRVRFDDVQGPGSGDLKEDRDAESLTIDPVSGRAWIGFEHWNGIWRYAQGFAAITGAVTPPEMREWPTSLGPEAMVRLRSGRFLVFSEGGDAPGQSAAALLFAADPTTMPSPPIEFGYQAPRGYRVTDAAELPDGRILLLHRRFHLPYGFSAKLTIADPRQIRAGGIVRGREIATIAPPLASDNYEAVAVTLEGDRTIVWIASDDNFSILQKSLLLKFTLD